MLDALGNRAARRRPTPMLLKSNASTMSPEYFQSIPTMSGETENPAGAIQALIFDNSPCEDR